MNRFNPLQALRISGPLFTALAMITGCAAKDEPAQDNVVKVGGQNVQQQWDESECWQQSDQCWLQQQCEAGGGTWQDGECVVEVPIDWDLICEQEGGTWNYDTEECEHDGEAQAECEADGGTWDPDLEECTSEEEQLCTEEGGTWDADLEECVFEAQLCEEQGGSWNPQSEECTFDAALCQQNGGTWNESTRECSYAEEEECVDDEEPSEGKAGGPSLAEKCANRKNTKRFLGTASDLAIWANLSSLRLTARQRATDKCMATMGTAANGGSVCAPGQYIWGNRVITTTNDEVCEEGVLYSTCTTLIKVVTVTIE